ncbi:unnamed protein product [Caenorhabditis auriculariae]|uniref:Gamma-secretase subunit PEN-2 n=1 Tax=Caenorhabditis auriculariae TaxID=2777116 RepID=A0A8S1H3R0_9PELO|nr:unnamed protein product [Caenorhabditis auriculariae]
MHLDKLSDVERVNLCKRYFLIGIFCLPFVWLTNFVWFFTEAFCKPLTVHRTQIRRYVIASGIGSLFWLVVFLTWETVFQYYRAQGLVWTDYLTFVFPKGRI